MKIQDSALPPNMESYRQRLQKHGSIDPDTKPIADSEFGVVLVLYTGGTIGMKIKSNGGTFEATEVRLHRCLNNAK